MGVAEPVRLVASDEVVRAAVREPCQLGVEERDLHVVSPFGALGRPQRGEDADRRDIPVVMSAIATPTFSGGRRAHP